MYQTTLMCRIFCCGNYSLSLYIIGKKGGVGKVLRVTTHGILGKPWDKERSDGLLMPESPCRRM